MSREAAPRKRLEELLTLQVGNARRPDWGQQPTQVATHKEIVAVEAVSLYLLWGQGCRTSAVHGISLVVSIFFSVIPI